MSKRWQGIRATMALACTSGCVSEYGFSKAATSLPGNDTSVTLRALKPALAVRATGCLMCHASVKSAVITDFGHGDSYFLDAGTGDAVANGSYYFNHSLESWQSASLEGNLIVPAQDVYRADHTGLLNSIDPAVTLNSVTVSELVRSPTIANLQGTLLATPFGAMAPAQVPVLEKSQIYIGVPTADQVLDLRASLSGVSTGFGVADGAEDGSRISGLAVSGAGAAAFVTNTGPLECRGDIVVKGTLFLNAPIIDAGGGSCRFHVSGAIFMQGELQWSGALGNSNLQLSSARAVMMGFDSSTAHNRLCLPGSASAAWTQPYAFTRGPGTNESKRQAIYDESLNIGALQDAANVANPTYSRLLLNAPEVHSRYTTHFKGAVIGEIVLFRLAQFYFEFDPVFESVSALPLLGDQILSVRD